MENLEGPKATLKKNLRKNKLKNIFKILLC